LGDEPASGRTPKLEDEVEYEHAPECMRTLRSSTRTCPYGEDEYDDEGEPKSKVEPEVETVTVAESKVECIEGRK
jgi:hypothetical protein